jgi:hypothetical protein
LIGADTGVLGMCFGKVNEGLRQQVADAIDLRAAGRLDVGWRLASIMR